MLAGCLLKILKTQFSLIKLMVSHDLPRSTVSRVLLIQAPGEGGSSIEHGGTGTIFNFMALLAL